MPPLATSADTEQTRRAHQFLKPPFRRSDYRSLPRGLEPMEVKLRHCGKSGSIARHGSLVGAGPFYDHSEHAPVSVYVRASLHAAAEVRTHTVFPLYPDHGCPGCLLRMSCRQRRRSLSPCTSVLAPLVLACSVESSRTLNYDSSLSPFAVCAALLWHPEHRKAASHSTFKQQQATVTSQSKGSPVVYLMGSWPRSDTGSAAVAWFMQISHAPDLR